MQRHMLRSLAVKYSGFIAIAYSLFIGWGSLAHVPTFVQEAPRNSDKLIHATAYFIFCSLWFLFFYFRGLKKRTFTTVLWIAISWSLFFGIVIEILQYDLTTYRSGDYWDVLANTTGVLLSMFGIVAFRRKLKSIKTEY